MVIIYLKMSYRYLINKSSKLIGYRNSHLCNGKHNFINLLQISNKLIKIQTLYHMCNLYYNFANKHFKQVQMNMRYTTGQPLCWNCSSSEISENFCVFCKMIQPIDKELNYFDILGIESSFKIHRNELTKSYRKLQNIFHPDKFSAKSEKEQFFATEYSSLLNKAYNVILHPVTRGEYMLSIAGHPIEEGELTMDPEFLMDIMEINERLADAEDEKTVQEIRKKNNLIMENLLREAEAAFSSNNITAARGIVAKLKYYNNIYEKVKEFETQHGIVY